MQATAEKIKTMKAIRQTAFGGPDVLRYEDSPMPALQSGEVLIRVRAVGLNPPDWYLREGYKALPAQWCPAVDFPLILGTDVSGVIEAVADDVEGLSVGEEVYAMVRFPSGLAGGSRAYAQYVTSGRGRRQTVRDRSCPRCGCAHVALDGLAVHGRTRA
ncbi:alcohol dehydrogenase catalytic domain-containing protein [Xanthomonas arboricola]|uniref:alcohol dehydrogenase catalytic domain-containing protein n=1 Tax=Xanthomonas arboricola TaxID=56448 RepID=UPI00181EC96B|nr:alcohol dehydrogenase catalytic domain-containing protein [Xanthomonas arboricola]MBB6575816.1 NADPH:quinone reductase-like Zn-dependent oxidoreductase [Xanthomonas arboricola]